MFFLLCLETWVVGAAWPKLLLILFVTILERLLLVIGNKMIHHWQISRDPQAMSWGVVRSCFQEPSAKRPKSDQLGLSGTPKFGASSRPFSANWRFKLQGTERSFLLFQPAGERLISTAKCLNRSLMMRLSPYQTARLKLQFRLAQALAADMYCLATKNWMGKSFEKKTFQTVFPTCQKSWAIPFFPSPSFFCVDPLIFR